MRVVLLGNYGPDCQESMLRYAQMMLEGLSEAGVRVTLATPQRCLNRARSANHGIWKWLGYLDKYAVGRREISAAVRQAEVVHICDHSNAVYIPINPAIPYVVTCHDLLAVRGALGESTDCRPSTFGRLLQSSILKGLRRASAIACVSQATLGDAQKLLGDYVNDIVLVPSAQNYPYRVLELEELKKRQSALPAEAQSVPYVLLVGSSHRRKNRETALRAFASIAHHWCGNMVFAGEPLSTSQIELAARLGITNRVVEIVKPDNGSLEALYNGALALLFPSRFEGFGWPIVEAQACACPVICSDRSPMTEVSGGAALYCAADDEVAFGQAIVRLSKDARQRAALVELGLKNASSHSRAAMIEQFRALYASVAHSDLALVGEIS